jgi:hypothetical protein
MRRRHAREAWPGSALRVNRPDRNAGIDPSGGPLSQWTSLAAKRIKAHDLPAQILGIQLELAARRDHSG